MRYGDVVHSDYMYAERLALLLGRGCDRARVGVGPQGCDLFIWPANYRSRASTRRRRSNSAVSFLSYGNNVKLLKLLQRTLNLIRRAPDSRIVVQRQLFTLSCCALLNLNIEWHEISVLMARTSKEEETSLW